MADSRARAPDPAWAVVVACALLAAPKLVRVWVQDPIFSVGLLVAPWAVWRIARAPASATAARAPVRVLVLVATLALAVAGWYTASAAAALWAVVAALGLVALERGAPRSVLLPLGLLAIAVPPPGFETLLVDAQRFIAWASGGLLGAMGMPVTRDAWFLMTPEYTFIVEPACTGLSGLLATTALVGIVAAHQGSPARRVLTALAVGAAATLTLNVIRIVLIVGMTHWRGPWFVEGAFHEGVSLALSLLAFALALPVLRERAGKAPTGVPS